jgi:hypothetical protein
MLNLKTTHEDGEKIFQIINNAKAAAIRHSIPIDRLQYSISLTACHLNGCPLDLDGLLNASEFNLLHDLLGIHKHINQEDGSLDGLFVPRYAAKQKAA